MTTNIQLLLAITVLGLVGGLLVPAAAQPWRDDPVQILTLSNRADLISGGDALVEIVLPERADPAQVTVTAGEVDVTDAFAVRDDGRFYGRLEGLPVGQTRITAALHDDSGAVLDITNHAGGGPVVAGPQVQPWICTTQDHGLGPAEDEQCNADTIHEYLYMPQGGGEFQPYDPDNPPQDVAETTTDDGVTVPYVVRRERGVIDRGIYDVVALFDPASEWEPWSPQAGWNRKLYWRFGGDCNPNHRQPSAGADPAVVGAEVLYGPALSRGFVVASSGLNTLGRNCNDVVSAEAVMMVKEHVIERYGEVRFTMSDGNSGGSMQQHWIVSNYPGLLNGIISVQSFPDVWQVMLEAEDCVLLDRAFTQAGLLDLDEMAAVSGHDTIQSCTAPSLLPAYARVLQDPTFQYGCQGGLANAPLSAQPVSWAYHPVINPTGARCTLQDYQVAQFGTRPRELWSSSAEEAAGGFANRPFDNTGVEYGRAALEAGAITPQQFIDLNGAVGGYDVDWTPQPERNVADPAALVAAYRGGRVVYPEEAKNIPILEVRNPNPCNNDLIGIHTCFHTYATRARLQEANGHADNQVILYQAPVSFSFPLLDEWLTAIEADASDDPLDVKVLRNKPADAAHACWSTGERDTDWEECQALNPIFANPRLAAGGPLAGNVLKCQLKPLDRGDYSVEFTDEQWAQLQAAFPDGVCDYSRPGVAQEPPRGPWQTYADGPVGVPLGAPPTSVPFGPEGPSGQVTRHAGPTRLETAVAVSGVGVEAADTVVLARADDYPDALAGGPLAVHLDAPLLLTPSDGLADAVAAEIVRLGAVDAVLLGGEAALSPQVVSDLESLGLEVRRVAGQTRWATAAAIAAELPPSDEVLLARGEDFPDALSASGLGSATATPVLLTEPDRLPPETRDALARDVDVTVIGGTAAISEAVASQVDAIGGDVNRLAGPTRYATSAAVADAALAAGVLPSTTWVATGADFPDALVAGAAAGHTQGVLVLIDGADLNASAETRDWLDTHIGDVNHLRIAGGTSAISTTVHQDLERP